MPDQPAEQGRPDAPADFESAGEHLTTVLHSLETAGRYTDWILDMAAPFLGPEVLEVGAGDGNVTVPLAGRGHRVTAAEPYPPFVARLRERVAGLDTVTVVAGDVLAEPEPDRYDAAVLINVLEHIEGDVEALGSLRTTVRPGGHVVLFVPAFQSLYSDFDRLVGHHRRYTLPQLEARVREAGWEVADSRYVNLPGWFAWLLVARWFHGTPTSPRRVRTYDRFVVPWLSRLEARFRPPFGQSVLVVGRRPA